MRCNKLWYLLRFISLKQVLFYIFFIFRKRNVPPLPPISNFSSSIFIWSFHSPSCVSFVQRKDLPRPSIASSTPGTWPQNPTTIPVLLLLLLYMDINLGLSAPSQVVSIVAYSSSSSSCFPTKADLMTSTLCRHSHNTKPVYHSLAQNRISALFSPPFVCVCVFRLFCLKAKFIVKVATAAAVAAASATAAAPTKTFVIRQKSWKLLELLQLLLFLAESSFFSSPPCRVFRAIFNAHSDTPSTSECIYLLGANTA